jgi:hypothetical protein
MIHPTHHHHTNSLLVLLIAQLAGRDLLCVQLYSHTQTSVATLYYVFVAEFLFFPEKRILIFNAQV